MGFPYQILPIDVMILFDGKDILTFIKRTIKHVLPLARYNLYVGKYENKKTIRNNPKLGKSKCMTLGIFCEFSRR